MFYAVNKTYLTKKTNTLLHFFIVKIFRYINLKFKNNGSIILIHTQLFCFDSIQKLKYVDSVFHKPLTPQDAEKIISSFKNEV